jgi:hypothetical protein
MPSYLKPSQKPHIPSEEELEEFKRHNLRKTVSTRVDNSTAEAIIKLAKETNLPKSEIERRALAKGLISMQQEQGHNATSSSNATLPSREDKGKQISDAFMRRVLFGGVDLKNGRSVQTKGWSSQ